MTTASIVVADEQRLVVADLGKRIGDSTDLERLCIEAVTGLVRPAARHKVVFRKTI